MRRSFVPSSCVAILMPVAVTAPSVGAGARSRAELSLRATTRTAPPLREATGDDEEAGVAGRLAARCATAATRVLRSGGPAAPTAAWLSGAPVEPDGHPGDAGGRSRWRSVTTCRRQQRASQGDAVRRLGPGERFRDSVGV